MEEGGYEVCFNDYQDLMVAARIGRNGSVRQIAGYPTDPNDTRPRFVSWAIFEIVRGTTLNRQTGEQEEGCLCIGSVFIMLNKTIFLELRHFVVRSLQPCVGSVFMTKLT